MSSTRFSRRPLLWAGVGLALAAAVAAVAFDWLTPAAAGADPDDPVQVSLGRAVYSENCASCHGVRLEGQPNWRIRKPDGRLPAPPHDETGHTWHHPDKQLFDITKSGVAALVSGYDSDMPAYRGVLSDEQIWAVLAFIKSTWQKSIRQRQERRSQGVKQ